MDLARGLAISAEIGEPGTEGFGTAYVGFLDVWTGAPDAALERLERCLERLIVAGAGWPIATVQWALGLAQASLGRADEARATLNDVVERGADGYSWALSAALSALAALDRVGGDAAAAAHARRALEVAHHVGSDCLSALAHHELGRLAAGRSEWAEAARLLHASLRALSEGEHLVFVPDSLEALAEVAAGLERNAEAACLLAAADRARADLGLVR